MTTDLTTTPRPPTERLLALWLSGRTEATIKTYGADLKALAEYAGARNTTTLANRLISSRALATTTLLEWRAAMLDAKLAPNTINRRLSAVRSLLHLARLTDYISWEVEVPNVPVKIYKDVTGPPLDEVRELVNRLGMMSDKGCVQSLAMVRMMFDMGLRRVECCRLDMADVSFRGRSLMILGKGQHEKYLMRMPKPTSKALAAWIRKRGRHEGPVFQTKAGNRVSPEGISHLLALACERVGVDKIKCHGLRHSAVTALAADGCGLHELATFGRWSKKETAAHYLDSYRDAPGKLASKLAEKV